MKMFDGVVRTLTNIRYIPRLRRSLISLVALDTLGCEYSAKGSFMKVRKDTLVVMKGEKVKNLYRLIGKIFVSRAVKVEPCQERSSSAVKEVARMNECNKLAVTTEGKAWKKKKSVFCVKFNESLNSTHVYSC